MRCFELCLKLFEFFMKLGDDARDVGAQPVRILELERRSAAADPDVEVIERDGTHAHADLARPGVSIPLPFQPDMILTALGMAQYDPTPPITEFLFRRQGKAELDQAPVEKRVAQLHAKRCGRPGALLHH